MIADGDGAGKPVLSLATWAEEHRDQIRRALNAFHRMKRTTRPGNRDEH